MYLEDVGWSLLVELGDLADDRGGILLAGLDVLANAFFGYVLVAAGTVIGLCLHADARISK